MVEIRAGLLLLEWAINRQLVNVCIKTDCQVFVRGLLQPEKANPSLRSALYDFRFLYSFLNVVKVVKESRQVVKAAHNRAKLASK